MESVGASGVMELGVIALFCLMWVVGGLVTVIPFWKICTKAGFAGALSLLMLVPIANIVLPFYIAFAQWPVFKGRE